MAATPARALPEPPHKRGSRVIIIAIIGVLVVALAGLGVYFVPKFLDSGKPGGSSATQAVQAYLDALAGGDADLALSYSAQKPDDTTFMTSDILKAALAANPLTGIQIPAGQSNKTPAVIEAAYSLGGQAIQAHFTVQKYGRKWLLDGGYMVLNLVDLTSSGVPLTVSGHNLGDATKVALFPGTYTLATADPMLDLAGGTFTIEYPESHPTFDQFRFVLSTAAVGAIQAATQNKLDWCVAQKDPRPAGCGFGFAGAADGSTIDPASVDWTVEPDSQDITTMQPALDGSSTTVATAALAIKVHFSANSTDKRHMYNVPAATTAMKADFSDPTQIVVTFG